MCNNSLNNSPVKRTKHDTYKIRRRKKPNIFHRFIYVILTIAAFILGWITADAISSAETSQELENLEQEQSVICQTSETTESEQDTPEESTAETVENETAETTQEPAVFFALTTEQRTLIEQVVSAESRGEPYNGQVAVAQCILNACLKDDITPEQAIKKYKYTTARAEPTDSVKKAVAAVFDRGEGITEEPIIYFYAPALVDSKWHESQIFVIEIANHRFFKEGPAE